MPSKEKVIEVQFLPSDIQKGATYLIKQSNPNSYTHGMFKYPCKFIPEIPKWSIDNFLKEKKGIVFDPFAGSGTTLLEATIKGFNSYGTEIDDIAKLIIKVKTTQLKPAQIKLLEYHHENIIKTISQVEAETFIPNITNLEHWFSKVTINELGKMKVYIDKIEDKDVKDFFKLCMVSIIKRVSNADDTSPKPYGLPTQAPGGKTGTPDLIFTIDDLHFVVELTTIKPKALQFSAEGSSVPDHIRLYKQTSGKNVVGIFCAPTIHERNTIAMQSTISQYGIKLHCITEKELVELLLTKDRNKIKDFFENK